MNLRIVILFVILLTAILPAKGGYIKICDRLTAVSGSTAEVVSVSMPHFYPDKNNRLAIFLFQASNDRLKVDYAKSVLSHYLRGTFLQKQLVSLEDSDTSTDNTTQCLYPIPENIQLFIWEVMSLK